jgi:hypothetical protein
VSMIRFQCVGALGELGLLAHPPHGQWARVHGDALLPKLHLFELPKVTLQLGEDTMWGMEGAT